MKRRKSITIKKERVAIDSARKFLKQEVSLLDLRQALAEYENTLEKEPRKVPLKR